MPSIITLDGARARPQLGDEWTTAPAATSSPMTDATSAFLLWGAVAFTAATGVFRVWHAVKTAAGFAGVGSSSHRKRHRKGRR